jgi:hypothetical protein
MGELLDKLLTINDSKNCEITNSDIEALSAEIASPEIYKTNSLLQNTSLLNKTSTTEMSILKSREQTVTLCMVRYTCKLRVVAQQLLQRNNMMK